MPSMMAGLASEVLLWVDMKTKPVKALSRLTLIDDVLPTLLRWYGREWFVVLNLTVLTSEL